MGNIQPSILCPHPSVYVRHALSTLGIASSTCGYWPHAFQVCDPSLTPSILPHTEHTCMCMHNTQLSYILHTSEHSHQFYVLSVLQAWIFSLVPSWLWTETIFTITRFLRRQALKHSIQRGDGHIFVRKRTNSNATGRRDSSSARPHSPAKAFNFTQVQHGSFVMRTESIRATPGILKKISREGTIGTPSSVHSTSPITSTPSSGLPSHKEHSVVMVVPSLLETTPAQNSASLQETETETQPL